MVDQNNNIVTNSGTSFSSPIMAGGLASLWQAVPSLTNAQIMQVVRESSSQYSTPDYLLGYGIPDLQEALSLALSVEEFENPSNTIKLYPNPIKDKLKISYAFRDGETISVKVYNILGKLVVSADLNAQNKTINTSNLPNGVYLAQLKTSSNTKTIKLIKQ